MWAGIHSGREMAYLADLLEVADKVLLKVLVEVGSHQVGAAWVHTEDDGQVQPVSGRKVREWGGGLTPGA